jgi:hypothetical protein
MQFGKVVFREDGMSAYITYDQSGERPIRVKAQLDCTPQPGHHPPMLQITRRRMTHTGSLSSPQRKQDFINTMDRMFDGLLNAERMVARPNEIERDRRIITGWINQLA